MAIHSIRDHYPEAKNWICLYTVVIDGKLIRIYEIWTHDGAHFIEALLIQDNDTLTTVRILDLA